MKVSDKIKKEMEEFKDKVEWPTEIRGFIEVRLDRARREDAVYRVENMLRSQPRLKRGVASRVVREDRDGGH